ncbi:undecaprenyl diphosphate synthase family protein [Streptomyces sp. NPDC001450]
MFAREEKTLGQASPRPRRLSATPDPNSRQGTVPQHVAVILDGNRRWAIQRARPVADAYVQGALRVQELVAWCDEARVRFVTVWALSRDNLNRPPQSLDKILSAITTGLATMARAGRWRIRLIGAWRQLPAAPATAVTETSRLHDRIMEAFLALTEKCEARGEPLARWAQFMRGAVIGNITFHARIARYRWPPDGLPVLTRLPRVDRGMTPVPDPIQWWWHEAALPITTGPGNPTR